MEGSRRHKDDERVIPVRDAEAQTDDETAEDSQPEDEAVEPEVVEDAGDSNAEARVEEGATMEDELGQLRAKIEELDDQRLRALAELENYKRRTARQYDDMVRSAHEKILSDLLEVVDNFERALKHDDERSGERTEEGKAFRQGTEMIYNQMQGLLEKYDVKPIESLGKPFDPTVHEALMQTPSEEYPEGTVAMEMARGYMQGERVLRHAKVGVSSGPPEENDK
ncbi:nucleotide exchange factor GrpE [candidate division GN15 bacterium]|nr:nucleotide exchange factor GrpE [candidate division GN15 bacterium]